MRMVFLTLAVATACLQAAAAVPPEIRIEVWAHQRFEDPFCSNDPVEIFFRVDQCAYLTVYQINPWGGVDIVYPRSHHRWVMVLPHRTYCLSDLEADVHLHYDGVEGSAYLGIIATADPIDVVPWLEGSFRGYGFRFGRSPVCESGVDVIAVLGRIQADLRFRIGRHCVPTFFTQVIHLRPRPGQGGALPPVVIHPAPQAPVRLWESWEDGRAYRQEAPDFGKQRADVRSRSPYLPYSERREISKKRNNPPEPEKTSNKSRRMRKPTN